MTAMRSKLMLWMAALLLLTGCFSRPADQQAGAAVLLIDLSGSTDNVKGAYLQTVGDVLARMEPGERLFVLGVSATSLTDPLIADVEFPPYAALTTNSFTHGREMKRLREETLAKVSDLLERPRSVHGQSRGTSLIDALANAGDLLRPYPGAATVICLSDMVEQSDQVDLYDLTKTGVDAALARVAAPALKGVQVYAAGLEGAAALPPERNRAIRLFWTRLLEQAGADLAGYGPTALANFRSSR